MYWIYLPIMKKWLNLHNVDTVSQHWSDDGTELKSLVAMMQSGVRVLIVAPQDMTRILGALKDQ